MSKILVFSTFALVLIFAGAFSFAAPAQASQYCANGSTMTGQEVANAVSAGALSFTWSDNSGQMTVHVNNTTNCSVPLTLASYKMFQEPGTSGWLSSQQFYAESPLTNATPNSITNISVSTPSCKVQVDLWYQTAPHQLLDSDPYHNPNALPYVISAASTLTPLCVACTSHTTKQCVGSSVYWFNSCGAQEDLYQACTSGQTCSSGSCITQNILCSSNSDCGTSGYINSPFCQNGNVYQDYKTWTCNNAGTPQSSCSNTTVAQLKTTCSSGQTCTNGSCTAVLCSSNSDCGASGYSGSQYCQGNSIYRNYITYTCNNPGTPQSSCSNHTDNQLYQTCSGNQTCQNGSCSGQNCTYHSYQQCSGNYLYWYDSCGVQQDSTYCPNGCSNNACQGGGSGGCQNCSLTLNKTVKNLTSGNSGFVNSVYANPGDTLMFMITLLANGNQNVQNVFVRDYFPSNLIYQNQLIISGSNYTTSGNIISGINLGTINAGQTVTITYQAQVAAAQNFNYGTTTLSNSVTATSSSAASTPSASASVVVTRTAVLAASVISTGLTNNFLVDSFLLPLALALLGIWMLKSGMLFGVEKWISQKRRVRRDFKAEKELIKKIEEVKTREVA